MDAKATLRAEIRAKILALSATERAEKSARIAQHFLASELYKKARTVFAYASSAREVSTRAILEQCLRDGKTLGLPHTGPAGTQLVFHRVTDLANDVVKGRFGILEPREELAILSGQSADVIVVPGVAFTLKGERLGQGGGYYDRFLNTLPDRASRVAFVFDCQIVSTLPVEPHDERVKWLARETEFCEISS
jgi:5-formyltetrahydrofolate cyclo-ligase